MQDPLRAGIGVYEISFMQKHYMNAPGRCIYQVMHGAFDVL